jgi:hypothetical protein
MESIQKVGNQLAPLCMLPSGKLLCYRFGRIYLLNQGEIERSFSVFTSKKETLLGRSKWAYRLLRLGVRASIAIDEEHVILSVGNMLYELNLVDGQLSQGYFCGLGIRPLIFTEVKGIESFEDGIYFGGYLSNRDKRPVSIYRRVGVDQWKIVHTFPQGSVNHVHAIVSDAYRQCLWIFTGDFGEAAAIRRVTHNFEAIEIVGCNDQKYRACVAFALPEGILYATDTPFADDYIYLMNPKSFDLERIAPIDGSCIYGCQWNDRFVFSSTVEPDGREESRLSFFFGRKRGAGIKNQYVHLYVGNPKNGFKEIYKDKKDFLPYCTFQFGVFKFPYGMNNTDTLYLQPVATQKHDLSLLTIR